jgi:hypothetical protein
MGQAYQPYEPLNSPKPVANDIWIVDGPEIRMNYLGFKLPFPTRMTIIRLQGGRLWLHSPTRPDPALIEDIGRLGPVDHLVAPNSLHYWWIPEWHELFPDARVHAVPGLAERARRPLPPLHVLGDSADPAWAGSIDQLIVSGGLLTEAVFFHRASHTLILTDLIENFEPSRIRSSLLRLLMRLSGAADPDGKAPFDMQLSFRRHRGALREAVGRMIEWAPERVILAHGRWYGSNGTAELRRAFRWVF